MASTMDEFSLADAEGGEEGSESLREDSAQDKMKQSSSEPAAVVPKPGEIEDLVRVDRRKLEELILAGSGESQPAQVFFDKIMAATGCTILWPSRLKIGARSKKDPNVKMIGFPQAVEKAKAMMLKDLDTKSMRVTLKMDIPHNEHSHIIGVRGKTVRQVSEETGCHIHFPDSNRVGNMREKSNQVSINGSIESVEVTRVKIRSLLPVTVLCDIPLQTQFDPQAPAIHQFIQTYSVSISVKYAPLASSYTNYVAGPVVQCEVEGTQENVEGIKSVIFKLHEYYGCSINPATVLASVLMSVPTQHHQAVMEQSRRIMEDSNIQIAVDPPGRNGLTRVMLTGMIADVLVARQRMVGCFPLVLMFDVGDDSEELDKIDVRQRLMEKYDVFISVKPKSRPKQKSVLLKSLEQNAHCIYEAREVILKYTPSTPSPEVPPAPPSYVQAPPTIHSSYPKMQMDPVTGDLETSSCSTSNVAVSITSGSQNGCGTVQPPQDSEGVYTSSKMSEPATKPKEAAGMHQSYSPQVSFELSPRTLKDYELKRERVKQAMKHDFKQKQDRYPNDAYAGYHLSLSMPSHPIHRGFPRGESNLLTQDKPASHLMQPQPQGLRSLNQPTLTKLLAAPPPDQAQPKPNQALANVKDISDLLRELHLEKYEANFADEEIDLDVFLTMSEKDFEGIGITTLGSRRKLMMASKDLQQLQGYSATGY